MNAKGIKQARMLPLVLFPMLVMVNGCASVDPPNTDTRAWGRPSAHEQREQWWGAPGAWYLLFPSPMWEQQRNEEWLNQH